jgi:hypothetical protein
MVNDTRVELPKGLDEKWKLVKKLKKNPMKTKLFYAKFKCSLQTARNWINKAKLVTRPLDFIKERGRQPLLSQTERLNVNLAAREAAFANQALLSSNARLGLPTFRTQLQQVREEYASQNGMPIPKELSYKQSYNQRAAANVTVITAQEITKAHLAALNDVRMGISTCIAGMAIGKTLGFNPALFFNMDMSGHSKDGIGKAEKLRIVIDKDQKDELDVRGVPASTRAPNPETTGVFVKEMTCVSAMGHVAPFVFSVRDQTMQKGETLQAPIPQLSLSGSHENEPGFITFQYTLNGSCGFYVWYYKNVLIPFIKSTRMDLNAPEDEWAVLWMDGEQIQVDPLFTEETRELFRENHIHVMKGAASTTPVTQLLDASDIFKIAHKLGRNEEKTDRFRRCQLLLMQKVKDALTIQNKKNGKEKTAWDNAKVMKYTECIVNATFGLREALSPMNIRTGVERTGLFNESNMTGISTIMRNFNQHLTHQQWLHLQQDLEKALPIFVKHGQLKDEVIERMEYVQQLVRHGKIQINCNHRDNRTLIQQRAVLLTHDETFKRRYEEILLRNNKVTAAAERKLNRENLSAKGTVPAAVVSSKDKKQTTKKRQIDRISSQQGSYGKIYANTGSSKRTRCESTVDEDIAAMSTGK